MHDIKVVIGERSYDDRVMVDGREVYVARLVLEDKVAEHRKVTIDLIGDRLEVITPEAFEHLAPRKPPGGLDREEWTALERIREAHAMILGWGLVANAPELAAAVHVIQGFIVQHVLARTSDYWSNWYAPATSGRDLVGDGEASR